MITCRDLPEAISQAEKNENRIAPPLGTAAKAALYQSMREAHVNKSELEQLLGVPIQNEKPQTTEGGAGSRVFHA